MTLDAFQLGREKFEKDTLRTINDAGFGATKQARLLVNETIDATVDVVKQRLEADATRAQLKGLIPAIKGLDPTIIALIVLQGGINSVARLDTLSQTCKALGGSLEEEVWAAGFRTKLGKRAAQIEMWATKRNSRVKDAKQAVRSAARSHKNKSYMGDKWSAKERFVSGLWLTEIMLETGVFVKEGGNPAHITMTAEALQHSEEMIEELINRHPVALPLLAPPSPWKGATNHFESNGRKYRRSLIRSKGHDKLVQNAIEAACKSGQMDAVLQAINTIQKVPLKINEDIRTLISWCYDNGIKVKGLPPKTDVPKLARVDDAVWAATSEDQKRLRKRNGWEIGQLNRSYLGLRETLKRDLLTADAIIEGGNKFYTPHNMDYRGRIYPTCNFGYQRQDYVRGMFMFAEGKPLGERGMYWLKIHLANCGDFDKVSKRSFAERILWVDTHMTRIVNTAADPAMLFGSEPQPWWCKAAEPFQFVAACIEYTHALVHGPDYVCHLPVGFDGSCSGLQHLCAMTRSEEGHLVNLMPTEAPNDIYSTVAELVKLKIEAIAAEDGHQWQGAAKKTLAYGVDRKLVKRNVMTYAYSGTKMGMIEQQREDTMWPKQAEVVAGELAEHPFEVPEDTYAPKKGKAEVEEDEEIEDGEEKKLKCDPGRTAAAMLGTIVYDTIEEVIRKPAEAMHYLRSIARTCAHESKPAIWHTPLGMPVVLHEPDRKIKPVQLFMQTGGVTPKKHTIHIAENKKTINKTKAANAIAPGFVHSMDACHLQMVALAASKEGITNMAFVHDSFGCLPGDAEAFRKIINGQFYWLYSQYDVLADIDKETRATIENSHEKLKPLPEKGGLNIEDILNADYTFA